VIDAVRARNLSCYGYVKKTSPNIDNIAKEGIIFNNCYSCINTTDPSITTILSGKYPLTHGLIDHGVTDENYYLKKSLTLKPLQSILRSKGYMTIAIDWLGRWHKMDFVHYSGSIKKNSKFYERIQRYKIGRHIYNMGLSLFKKIRPYKISYDVASDVTNYALKLINEYSKKNFFLFIHFWDPHAPYYPPTEYLKIFKKEKYYSSIKTKDEIINNINNEQWKSFVKKWIKKKDINDILASYDAEINYVDTQIGKLTQGLRDLDIYDNTIFLITSDHGESLTEHGIYFDHHGLYDVNIHVPLIIRYPHKIDEEKNISSLVQHVDIVPTTLDLLNVNYCKDNYDGKSLVPLIKKDVEDFRSFIYAEEVHTQRKIAIRTNKYKYIFSPFKDKVVCSYCGKIHGALEELYDLESDPNENINIAYKTEIAKELRSQLENFIKELKYKKIKNQAIYD